MALEEELGHGKEVRVPAILLVVFTHESIDCALDHSLGVAQVRWCIEIRAIGLLVGTCQNATIFNPDGKVQEVY